MALITCPGCSKEISDAAPACPQCGQKMKVNSQETVSLDAKEFLLRRYSPLYGLASRTQQVGGVFLVGGLILGMVFLLMADSHGVIPLGLQAMPSVAVAVFGFFGYTVCNIAAAMIRAFADTALWTAPVITDDEKLAIAKALEPTGRNFILGELSASRLGTYAVPDQVKPTSSQE